MKKVHISSEEPVGRISCTQCGNTKHFVEREENILVTTLYQQNNDGSFTTMDRSTEIFGAAQLLCGKCGADVTCFREHFLEMLF